MKITIIVEDENLDFMQRAEVESFEIAGMHLGSMERNYQKRVALEMDANLDEDPETI